VNTSLSFIIPTLNEAQRIALQLADLRQRYPDCELVVVDGGSTDATVREALTACDQLLLSPPGRAQQMNLGAKVARGQYLAFLHADTRPMVTWEELLEILSKKAEWGFFHVRLSGSQPLLRLVEWA